MLLCLSRLKQPTLWTAMQVDCCVASGISQLVTRISWTSMGLNGSINGTALSSELKHLCLNNYHMHQNLTWTAINKFKNIFIQ